jgi:hypothetical protein
MDWIDIGKMLANRYVSQITNTDGSFDQQLTLEQIAASEVIMTVLSMCYHKLVYAKQIPTIDDPQMAGELEEMAAKYAPGLKGKLGEKFKRSLLALSYLVDHRKEA